MTTQPKLIQEIEVGEQKFLFYEGETTIIVGANGTGKTRLAAYFDRHVSKRTHRISAHRALKLKPQVSKISEQEARTNFLNRSNLYDRYQSDKHSEITGILNDFDQLIQILFAQQSNIAQQTHYAATHAKEKSDFFDLEKLEYTLFQKLQKIWEMVLPHRKLHITGDDILVSTVEDESNQYSATAMSDGERAVFYLIGQVLVAPTQSILIFDEPELHIHRSIMSRLWEKIKELRSDCAFVLITHDLEFAGSQIARKFVIQSYSLNHSVEQWQIQEVPENEYFDEQTVALILGSRKPILFIEGTKNSLDKIIYSSCYPDFMVVPRSSCSDVIHSVQSLRNMEPSLLLSTIPCYGIIDLDDRDSESATELERIGVFVLPFAEIENVFSHPDVLRVLLKKDNFQGDEIDIELKKVTDKILSEIERNYLNEKMVKNYLLRKIDAVMKRSSFEQASLAELPNLFRDKMHDLADNEITTWQTEREELFKQMLADGNIKELLKHYDDKGLLKITASAIRRQHQQAFVEWIFRSLGQPDDPLNIALRKLLPRIPQ